MMYWKELCWGKKNKKKKDTARQLTRKEESTYLKISS